MGAGGVGCEGGAERTLSSERPGPHVTNKDMGEKCAAQCPERRCILHPILALRLVLKRVEAGGTAACQVVPAPRELHCLRCGHAWARGTGRETECGVGCGVTSTEEGVEREPGNRLTAHSLGHSLFLNL